MSWFVNSIEALPRPVRAAVLIVGAISAVALIAGGIALGGWLGWSVIALFSYIGPIFPVAGAWAFLGGAAGLTLSGLTVLVGSWLSGHAAKPVSTARVATPHVAAVAGASLLLASGLVPVKAEPTPVSPSPVSSSPSVSPASAPVLAATVTPTKSISSERELASPPVESTLSASVAGSNAAQLPSSAAGPEETRTVGIVGRLGGLTDAE